ncbi:hypothetical protein QQ045_008713 [Rhodiola kirilowii]
MLPTSLMDAFLVPHCAWMCCFLSMDALSCNGKGFVMSNGEKDSLLQMETTCGTLLYERQIIWDEVGEPDSEKDRMLLELEQETKG